MRRWRKILAFPDKDAPQPAPETPTKPAPPDTPTKPSTPTKPGRTDPFRPPKRRTRPLPPPKARKKTAGVSCPMCGKTFNDALSLEHLTRNIFDHIISAHPSEEGDNSEEAFEEEKRHAWDIAESVANRMKTAAINYHPDYEERLHPTLQESIESGETPFHGNRSVPRGTFIEDVASDRFRSIIEEIRQHSGQAATHLYGSITDVKHAIQGIEENVRPELEQLAVRLVQEYWGIGENELELEAHLVPSGEVPKEGINYDAPPMQPQQQEPEQEQPSAEPDEEYPGFPAEDMELPEEEAMNPARFRSELEKRRIVNAFIQGSATKAKYLIHMGAEELNAIDPNLMKLYKQYIPLVSLGWWIKPVANRMSGTLGGSVHIEYPDEGDMPNTGTPPGEPECNAPECPPRIRMEENEDIQEEEEPGVMKVVAYATTFPTLVSELVKGVMEVVSLHGLPEDDSIAQEVMNETDTLLNERWDLRFGPAFWDRLLEAMDVEDSRIRAKVYELIVTLSADEFHNLVRGVLSKSPDAKQELQGMVDQARQELL